MRRSRRRASICFPVECAGSLTCDIGDRAAAERFVDEVAEAFGRIDVVVNNAGIIRVAAFDDQTVEDVRDAMQANFWGPVHVTFRAMGRLKVQGRDARIVNVTSLGGRLGMPHMLGYAASKFALVGFSETARAELDGQRGGPRVVTVIPGLMRTGSFENAEFEGKRSEEFGWFALVSNLPLVTIDARRAARRIVEATRDGRPFVRLGLSAFLGDIAHRISPTLTTLALGFAARVLPNAAKDEGQPPTKGREIESPVRGLSLVRGGARLAAAHNESPRR